MFTIKGVFMKKLFIVASLLLTSVAVVAADSSSRFGPPVFTVKGGHGGKTGPAGNVLDIISTMRCNRWVKGSEYLAKNSVLQQTLKKVEDLHWLTALQIKREIEKLAICETGRLVSIPASNSCEGFIPVATYKHEAVSTKQAAIRIGYEVYLDKAHYDYVGSLPDGERKNAELIMHEAAHSFYKDCEKMRTMKLYGFSHTLSKVRDGLITNRADLLFQLQRNGFETVSNIESIDKYKDAIKFSLSSPEVQRSELLRSAQSLQKITSQVNQITNIDHLKTMLCSNVTRIPSFNNQQRCVHAASQSIYEELVYKKRELYPLQTYSYTDYMRAPGSSTRTRGYSSLFGSWSSRTTSGGGYKAVTRYGTYDPHPGPLLDCLLYTSPSPRDATLSRMPSSA